VRVLHGTERREKETDSRYFQEASAPAAVTVYQTYDISSAHVHLQQTGLNCSRVISNDHMSLAINLANSLDASVGLMAIQCILQ